ncbi:MAG TPA: phage holin family protein [Candidatus Limnocylindria bacterium]
MYDRPGYRTLLGRIRGNVRTLIRKQLELPRQELAEIARANLQALKWLAIGAAFGLLTFIALTVFVIALVAIVLPWWLSALLVMLLFAALAAYTGYRGYKKIELRGPTRSIKSIKETVQWAKARLLGQSES